MVQIGKSELSHFCSKVNLGNTYHIFGKFQKLHSLSKIWPQFCHFWPDGVGHFFIKKFEKNVLILIFFYNFGPKSDQFEYKNQKTKKLRLYSILTKKCKNK